MAPVMLPIPTKRTTCSRRSSRATAKAAPRVGASARCSISTNPTQSRPALARNPAETPGCRIAVRQCPVQIPDAGSLVEREKLDARAIRIGEPVQNEMPLTGIFEQIRRQLGRDERNARGLFLVQSSAFGLFAGKAA